MRPYGGRCLAPAASYSRGLDDDVGTDICYVHPPGAMPERSRAWREMAVDRPGDCQGSRSVGVPAAGAGELGQRVFVFEIPVGPGVDQRGGRQEIALVAVASAVGKDEVFDSINAAADTRYEMVGLRCPAQRPATVKAAAGLQVGQALAQGPGRDQPLGRPGIPDRPSAVLLADVRRRSARCRLRRSWCRNRRQGSPCR
jgi:hypothetical protein